MNKVKGIQCEEVRNLETQVLVNVHRAIKDGNEHLDNVLNDKTIIIEEKEKALCENHIAEME